jgi:hypothetical protein
MLKMRQPVFLEKFDVAEQSFKRLGFARLIGPGREPGMYNLSAITK